MALSQRSFETEKGAAVIIDRDVKAVVPTVDPELANKYRSMQIPRRPKWDMKRSPEEQDRMERLDFLEWRRNVAKYPCVELSHRPDKLRARTVRLRPLRRTWKCGASFGV